MKDILPGSQGRPCVPLLSFTRGQGASCSTQCMLCLLGEADLLGLPVTAALLFGRGCWLCQDGVFSPLNAFYGDLSCQHMGSTCFYSFQTALLSSPASLYLEALGEQWGNEGRSWWPGPALPGRASWISPIFYPGGMNDSTLPVTNLAEHLTHLLAAWYQCPEATPWQPVRWRGQPKDCRLEYAILGRTLAGPGAPWARRAMESWGCAAGLCGPARVKHRGLSQPTLAFGLLRHICLSPFVPTDLNESKQPNEAAGEHLGFVLRGAAAL